MFLLVKVSGTSGKESLNKAKTIQYQSAPTLDCILRRAWQGQGSVEGVVHTPRGHANNHLAPRRRSGDQTHQSKQCQHVSTTTPSRSFQVSSAALSLSLCLSQILKKLRLLNLGPKKKEPRRDHRTVVRADRTVVHACWMGLSKSLGLRQSVAPNIFAHSNFLGFLKRADGRSCWASLSAKHG